MSVPIRNNPRLQDLEPLCFDNVSKEDVLSVSERERAKVFWSEFREDNQPLEQFRFFSDETKMEVDEKIGRIYGFYQYFVISNGWAENKFANILLKILKGNLDLTTPVFFSLGKQYDRETKRGPNTRGSARSRGPNFRISGKRGRRL